MEFIKGNNNSTETKIKVATVLPASANENDIILVKEDGIYQYKNNQWTCIISFIAGTVPAIIGEIRASIGQPDNNWLLCDGSTFSATDYPELYSLLGGTTLPDFRELIPIGVGTNGTDSVIDHDTFTRGQIKDWNLQTHCHCKTECTHNHSYNTTCYAHTHTVYPRMDTLYHSCSGQNLRSPLTPRYRCLTTGTSNYGCSYVCAASWCSSPSIGNPPSGTAILRVNSYGVNFYIRAK